MAPRHVLTVEERIRGVCKALDSPRTPPQFQKPLQQQLAALQRKLDFKKKRRPRRDRRPPKKVGLLDWLGL